MGSLLQRRIMGGEPDLLPVGTPTVWYCCIPPQNDPWKKLIVLANKMLNM